MTYLEIPSKKPLCLGASNTFVIGKLPLTEYKMWNLLLTFLVIGDFRHLLITFANIFDPDQDQHNVGPDLDRICSTLILKTTKA